MNKLFANPAETIIAIIPPQRTIAPISHLNLSSNGTPINIVSSAKYLGVLAFICNNDFSIVGSVNDNDYSFYLQIKVMENKVERSVGILIKLKQTLPQTDTLQLYCALVHTLSIVWYNYMDSHVLYLFTEIKILRKSRDKNRCLCSFSRFSKPILLTVENFAN